MRIARRIGHSWKKRPALFRCVTGLGTGGCGAAHHFYIELMDMNTTLLEAIDSRLDADDGAEIIWLIDES